MYSSRIRRGRNAFYSKENLISIYLPLLVKTKKKKGEIKEKTRKKKMETEIKMKNESEVVFERRTNLMV